MMRKQLCFGLMALMLTGSLLTGCKGTTANVSLVKYPVFWTEQGQYKTITAVAPDTNDEDYSAAILRAIYNDIDSYDVYDYSDATDSADDFDQPDKALLLYSTLNSTDGYYSINSYERTLIQRVNYADGTYQDFEIEIPYVRREHGGEASVTMTLTKYDQTPVYSIKASGECTDSVLFDEAPSELRDIYIEGPNPYLPPPPPPPPPEYDADGNELPPPPPPPPEIQPTRSYSQWLGSRYVRMFRNSYMTNYDAYLHYLKNEAEEEYSANPGAYSQRVCAVRDAADSALSGFDLYRVERELDGGDVFQIHQGGKDIRKTVELKDGDIFTVFLNLPAEARLNSFTIVVEMTSGSGAEIMRENIIYESGYKFDLSISGLYEQTGGAKKFDIVLLNKNNEEFVRRHFYVTYR